MKSKRRTIYIIAGIIIFIFLFGNAGFRKLIKRYWELHKLRLTIEQLQRENILLKKEIYMLENDRSYIEKIARKELGLISPGEIEYRFKNED